MPQRDVAIVDDSFPICLEAHLYAGQRLPSWPTSWPGECEMVWSRWSLTRSTAQDWVPSVKRLPKCCHSAYWQQGPVLHFAMAFMAKLTNETIPWLWSLGCRVVVLSQVFHLQPGHYTKNLNLEAYNRRVDDANAAMVELKMDNIIYWSHESVLRRGSVTSIWHQSELQRPRPLCEIFSWWPTVTKTLRAIDR